MPQENFVGRDIAGYSLRQLVGEGGTAIVYRAEHPQLGTVAFKLLREKLRHERTAVARFTREAEFGRRVVHPNVIRTLDIGVSDGLHYLALEWADGELLEKYAKRKVPLAGAEVGIIITQLAAAVGAVHEAGIVHRDLKPDNAMYDPDTQVIKLLDFGIAAATDTAQDDRLTRAGFFVGTLMYVAPEALSGELVTLAADQYSLATIAYYLLSGCLPYVAKSPREMFTLLLQQPPTPLNAATTDLRFAPSVEQTVMRGLSRNPADRFPSVTAFAAALRDALTHDPPLPEPDDAGTSGLLSRVKGLFRR